ncbi:MAG: hypothetical protein JW850_11665 [Thermoflexales bacterium]|nr:hypothetical protein [Thermoflexales bacterium]
MASRSKRTYKLLGLAILGIWLCLGSAAYVPLRNGMGLTPAFVAWLSPESTAFFPTRLAAVNALTATPPSPLPSPEPTFTHTPTLPPSPTPTASPTPSATPIPTPTTTPTPIPSASWTPWPTLPPTPMPTPSATHFLMRQQQPGRDSHPTLADFWEGQAQFVVQVADTGLPMGESDTIVMSNGELWSYLHASARSAGALDRCAQPVEFPGCTLIYRSFDGGYSFQHDQPPVCQFDCQACPCDSERDHIDQQQYPRVFYDGKTLLLAYEYRARVFLRRSTDGLSWSAPEQVPRSGVGERQGCPPGELVGAHPYVSQFYDCLAGGPPGIYVEGNRQYIFVGMGQNPGTLGCYVGMADAPARTLRKCVHNPLFSGAAEYGPLEEKGSQTNPFFDFRMISSVEVLKVGERYYMLYEGIRGPGPNEPGDSQFGLGLARSQAGQIDGAWEKFPANPILVDLPGNIGLGHADLVVLNGQTLVYTSLDGLTRSRLALVWQ